MQCELEKQLQTTLKMQFKSFTSLSNKQFIMTRLLNKIA